MNKYQHRIKNRKEAEREEKSVAPDDSELRAAISDPNEDILAPTVCSSRTETIEIPCDPPSVPTEDPTQRSRKMHSTVALMDIDLKVIKKEYRLERRIVNGKIVSWAKKAEGLGPCGSRITWNAIATLITLTSSFCIPINRLAQMLKNDFGSFSSGQISRILKSAAEYLIPIYLELADQLADVSHLSGDDTKSRVLEFKAEKTNIDEKSPFHKVNERLGRSSLRKDGKGYKKRLTVSVVAGRTDLKDSRSWIYFFRSHFGDLGNLLSRVLQSRPRKLKDITIQSDLASFNKLDAMVSELFEVTQAGCGSHARRPIWRHRQDDPGFCYFFLRCFLALSAIEKRLKRKRAGPEEISRARQRYSRKIWLLILDRCRQLTGEIERQGDGKHFYRWPPDSEIYKGARYIIKNYPALTEYLQDPAVFLSNNLCERLLRREKMIISSSKFRKNETGRMTFDILQTISATCNAAGIKLREYLPYVWSHRDDLADNPQLYTPLVFAKSLSQSKNQEAS